MRKLIYDIAITGHHSEYIGHLIDYLSKGNTSSTDFIFVVHPEFIRMFPDLYEKTSKIDNVQWKGIDASELQKINEKKSFRKSLASMKIMHRYALEYKVNHVVVLDFHTIKYGAIFYTPPYTLSSILFQQFHRLNRKKQKLEYLKRYYLTKWSCRNKKIIKIHILNDSETVNYMNDAFNTNRFAMLPDPIPILEPLEAFDIFEHYNIESHRRIFLHIGALGKRKGTHEVIESALYLDKPTQKKTTILLVGKASSLDQETLFQEEIERVKERTDVQFLWDNQFVPSMMMKSLFNQCDTVLLPYKNAEFSSGILGHAAASEKRVIATGAGLIKELVERYQLGELLEIPNAKNMARKMTEISNKKFEFTGQREFVKKHSPEIFAEKILTA